MNQNEFRKYAIKHHGISSLTVDSYTAAFTKSPSNLTPYIIEERPMNVASMDVFSRLMMDRIIFLGEGINDYVANIVTAQLLFLFHLSKCIRSQFGCLARPEQIGEQKEVHIVGLSLFLLYNI
jgi:hypothetical protein